MKSPLGDLASSEQSSAELDDVQFGPFTLRISALELQKDGKVISREEKVVKALHLLARAHPNRVDRDTLITALWPNCVVTELSLTRLIADIRQVLGDCGKKQLYIKTDRGQGYRLLSPTYSLTEKQASKQASRQENLFSYKYVRRAASIFAGLCATAIIGFIFYRSFTPGYDFQNLSPSEYAQARIALHKNRGQAFNDTLQRISFPMKDGWIDESGEVAYAKDGIVVSPTNDRKRIFYTIIGPLNLTHATLEIGITADENFRHSEATIELFAQQHSPPWKGKWGCFIDTSLLSDQENIFTCTLDSPVDVFNLGKNEKLAIGLRAKSNNPQGNITITKAALQYGTSYTEKHWITLPKNLNLSYKKGVQYHPNKSEQNLEFALSGPVDLRNKTIFFTILVDDDFLLSETDLQPYVQIPIDWVGEWDCLVPHTALTLDGAEYACRVNETSEAFNLKKDDLAYIGINTKSNQKPVRGSVKIQHIRIADTILSPPS